MRLRAAARARIKMPKRLAQPKATKRSFTTNPPGPPEITDRIVADTITRRNKHSAALPKRKPRLDARGFNEDLGIELSWRADYRTALRRLCDAVHGAAQSGAPLGSLLALSLGDLGPVARLAADAFLYRKTRHEPPAAMRSLRRLFESAGPPKIGC